MDTLTRFVEEHPPEDLVFIVGQDAFSEMGDWKSPEKLFAMTNFAVITRPPEKSGHLARWMPVCARGDFSVSEDGLSAEHRKSHHWIRQVPIAPLDISSTRIRKRVSEERVSRVGCRSASGRPSKPVKPIGPTPRKT